MGDEEPKLCAGVGCWCSHGIWESYVTSPVAAVRAAAVALALGTGVCADTKAGQTDIHTEGLIEYWTY